MDGQKQYCLYMVYYYYCATVEAYKKKIFSFCFPILFGQNDHTKMRKGKERDDAK